MMRPVTLIYSSLTKTIEKVAITPLNFGSCTEDVLAMVQELETYFKIHKQKRPSCPFYMICCPCCPCLICFYAASFGAQELLGFLEIDVIVDHYKDKLKKENLVCTIGKDYDEDGKNKKRVIVSFTFNVVLNNENNNGMASPIVPGEIPAKKPKTEEEEEMVRIEEINLNA